MNVEQIGLLIEDGTELIKMVVMFNETYFIGGNKITKKQFEEVYNKYSKQFTVRSEHGGSMKHIYRIKNDY